MKEVIGKSNADVVRSELAKNPPTPRYVMPEATGLTRREVSTVFSYLRRTGELPPSSRSKSREAMRGSVSSSRGGIGLAMEPYIRMGMGVTEVVDMVYLEQGIVLDIKSARRNFYKIKSRINNSDNSEDGPNRVPLEAIKARREPVGSINVDYDAVQMLSPYVDLGMTYSEAKEALLFETGIALEDKLVKSKIEKARAQGKIRRLTEREKGDAAKSGRRTREQVRKRVLLWLDSVRAARIFDLDTSEFGRMEWGKWIDKCLDKGYVTTEGMSYRLKATDAIANSKNR